MVKHLAKTIPPEFVTKNGPKKRVGKFFLDYLRNGFGATSVNRGRGWDELQGLSRIAHWTAEHIADCVTLENNE